MLTFSLYVCLLLLLVRNTCLTPLNDSVAEWLPKCCPEGKVLTGTGKACIDDDVMYAELNGTDTEVNITAGQLSVVVDKQTILYRLEHKAKFNCVRHELLVIDDNVRAKDEDEVVVRDWFGEEWSLGRTELCVDAVADPRVYVALLCPSCGRVPCLNKCCSEDEQLFISDGGSQVNCVPSSTKSWSKEVHENITKRPFVFHGFPECSNFMYLSYPETPLGVSEHGLLRLKRMTVPRTEYCGDSSALGPAMLGCRQVLRGSLKPTLYGYLFCVGSVFLALTLILHLWLPELRKTLHSRVLVAHVVCLLVSYLGLATVNLAILPAPSPFCSATAFVVQFSTLAAIFWLNVMCVDIAWTFSGWRAPKASTILDSDGHKFLYYSMYAWGSTGTISAVTALLEYSSLVSSTSRLRPAFGLETCWFRYWESILLLVYGPMGVLLLINAALFVYTAYKIQQTQRDVASLVQHTGTKLRENKDRFALYLKLFGLMGVTWVFEIVSWLVKEPEGFWYVTDFINALRSVFIFLLFCLKKKVITLIKAKFSKKKGKKFPIHSRKSPSSKMTSSLTSQRTNSIQLSQVS